MAPTFLSAVQCGEDLHWLGVQDVVEFDSGWCLVSAWWRREKRKKKKRREKPSCGRRVSWDWTYLAGCAVGHSC
jgi:hypothetical protein